MPLTITLRQRIFLSVILPVTLLLISTGTWSFFYARASLLNEWRQVTHLRLEKAAHHLDMRLSRILFWMQAFAETARSSHPQELQTWITQQLRQLPGVDQARLVWESQIPAAARVSRVSTPRYTYHQESDSVTLSASLQDASGNVLGHVEAVLHFSALMSDLETLGWSQSYMGCLLDNSGQYLAHTDPSMKARHCLGETRDPLEVAMLQAMKEEPVGTILGPGHPPSQVIGFYRLRQAPWTIMLHAQGSQILAPVFRFSVVFVLAGIVCLILILTLLALGLNPVVAAIKSISRAARQVAQGDYKRMLPVRRRDEIGQLTESFNEMVDGLKERDFLSNTFGRYIDPTIARKLLSRPEARRLGGEKRQVAILFADIRGFTPIAESLSPEATITLLNHFFAQMISVIQKYGGIIVDMPGDAVLCFFDPLDDTLEEAARQALRCGLEMQQLMAGLTGVSRELEISPLSLGVGVHAGEVVVGNIGSVFRVKYGIVGSAVNLTHRIQAQARGGEVVVSDDFFNLVRRQVHHPQAFTARLKGVQDPVTLYRLGGLEDLSRPEKTANVPPDGENPCIKLKPG